MPTVDFYFAKTNLTATAQHLITLDATPTQGKTLQQVEALLVDKTVKLFEESFKSEPSVTGQKVNDGVLHAAVLWKGIGAIYSASQTVSGDGVLHHQANVNVAISGEFVIDVDLWANLG